VVVFFALQKTRRRAKRQAMEAIVHVRCRLSVPGRRERIPLARLNITLNVAFMTGR
jgi:hypothetical protein